jgi:hypothetical protein
MPRSKVDPGRPSENSPYRSLCMGFWAFEAIAVCFWTVLTADSLSGLYQASGSAVFPVACAVPCVRFSLYCSKPPFSFTTATLGMNGWLDLIHQGLSPWKRSPGFPWRTKSRVISRLLHFKNCIAKRPQKACIHVLRLIPRQYPTYLTWVNSGEAATACQ